MCMLQECTPHRQVPCKHTVKMVSVREVETVGYITPEEDDDSSDDSHQEFYGKVGVYPLTQLVWHSHPISAPAILVPCKMVKAKQVGYTGLEHTHLDVCSHSSECPALLQDEGVSVVSRRKSKYRLPSIQVCVCVCVCVCVSRLGLFC